MAPQEEIEVNVGYEQVPQETPSKRVGEMALRLLTKYSSHHLPDLYRTKLKKCFLCTCKMLGMYASFLEGKVEYLDFLLM